MSESNEQIIKFRYIFESDKTHEIDAETLLVAEKSFLDYVKIFSQETGVEIKLKIKSRESGSLIDDIIASVNNPIGCMIIGALITKFISPRNKLSKQEENKVSEDLLAKARKDLKNGDITKEDFEYFINNDPGLRKMNRMASNYFKILKQNLEIRAINVFDKLIKRDEFDSRIISDEIKNEIDDKAEILLNVITLNNNTNKMWNGVYNHKNINFFMNDVVYKRNQISQKPENTVIRCILKKQIDENYEDKIKYSTKKVLDSWKNNDPDKFSLYHNNEKKISDDQMEISELLSK